MNRPLALQYLYPPAAASDVRSGIEPARPGQYPCNTCGGDYGDGEDCQQCGASLERADDPVPMDEGASDMVCGAPASDATRHTPETVDAAAARANTSPTPAQIAAGNYRKGPLTLHGLRITIENPRGSTRSGVSHDGTRWESVMTAHYGEIKGTEGYDLDPVDVFIGPDPASPRAWVVDQIDPATGRFDEHKVVLGCATTAEATRLYLSNYSKGWLGLGAITLLTYGQLRAFLFSPGAAKRPLALPYVNSRWDAPPGKPGKDKAVVAQFDSEEDESGGRWVTIAGHPVYIDGDGNIGPEDADGIGERPADSFGKGTPAPHLGDVTVDGCDVRVYATHIAFEDEGVEIRVRAGAIDGGEDVGRLAPGALVADDPTSAEPFVERARAQARLVKAAQGALEELIGRPSRWKSDLRIGTSGAVLGYKAWSCHIGLASVEPSSTLVHELLHSFSDADPRQYTQDLDWEEGLVELLTRRHTEGILRAAGLEEERLRAVVTRMNQRAENHPYNRYITTVTDAIERFAPVSDTKEAGFLWTLLATPLPERADRAESLIEGRKVRDADAAGVG